MNRSQPAITIALAGQPNVGKSTVYNELTGQAQYMSNWPGKTCDVKTGLCSLGDHNGGHEPVAIVDLPGTYSLSANSADELIVRDYLLSCTPDVVVVIVDVVSLEKNLYLVAELLSLPVPLVIGLNMLDVAEQEGIRVEPHVLEAALGLPVVPLVASQGKGVRTLVETALRVAHNPQAWNPARPEIQGDHRAVLDEIEALVAGRLNGPVAYPPGWVALKLLEGDEEITCLVRERLGPDWEQVHEILLQHDDAFLAVASGRYEWIGRMVRAAVVRPKAGQVTITDRLDRFTTHPIAGMLILIGLLGVLFWLTYAVGAPLQGWLETHVVQAGAAWLRASLAGAPDWATGLLADGIVSGVGTVLTLLPILLIFFAGLGLLEDVGYMARAAFVMDRFMHLMGLHGKSFLPVFLGFGCNVPAIMGSRIIESPRAKLITILVTPLIPCTARLSVVAILAPIFFGPQAIWVAWSLIVLALAVFTALGIALHKLMFRGEQNSFIMELPLYHRPNLHTIWQGIWQRVIDFLKGAATIILVVSVLLWGLSTYPGGEIEASYLAQVGRWLAPLGELMGLEWEMMVALLTSFVRKENTISTLAVLYDTGQSSLGLAGALGARLSPASALAFLAVQVLFIPCVATVATMRQETGSWRWTLASVLLLFVISMAAGVVIYQGARFIGWGV